MDFSRLAYQLTGLVLTLAMEARILRQMEENLVRLRLRTFSGSSEATLLRRQYVRIQRRRAAWFLITGM